MDYISTVLFGDENNERYLGKNRIFICTSREQSTYIEKRNIHFPLLISCITYVELHTNYRKVFQLESGKLLWTFLTWMMTKSISCRGVILKDAGGAMAPPDFGRSVNLNLNKRGTDYDHLNTTGTPVFSDLPTALIRRQPGSLQSFCSYSAPFFAQFSRLCRLVTRWPY